MYRAAAQGKAAEEQSAAQALRGVSSPVWLQVCGLLFCFSGIWHNDDLKEKAHFKRHQHNYRYFTADVSAVPRLRDA